MRGVYEDVGAVSRKQRCGARGAWRRGTGRGRGELRGAEPASRGPVGPLLALHARLTDHDNSFRMQSRKHRRAREGIGRPVFPPARGFPRHSLTSDAVPSSREHAYRRHVAKGREREREEGYTGKGDERAPRDEPIARAGTQEANRQNATSERAREGPSFSAEEELEVVGGETTHGLVVVAERRSGEVLLRSARKNRRSTQLRAPAVQR